MPENSASWMRCAPGGGGFGSGGGVSRQHRGEQLLEIAALAEEDAERLIESERMLVPLHEHRVQSPIEVVAIADMRDVCNACEGIEHRAGTDRHAGRAQRAREIDDVVGERLPCERACRQWLMSAITPPPATPLHLVEQRLDSCPSRRAMSS